MTLIFAPLVVFTRPSEKPIIPLKFETQPLDAPKMKPHSSLRHMPRKRAKIIRRLMCVYFKDVKVRILYEG